MLKNFTLLGRVVQSLIKLSWNKREFWFQVLNFSLGFSDYIVRPSVLSLNDLNLRWLITVSSTFQDLDFDVLL